MAINQLVQTAVRNAAVDLMWANTREDRHAVLKLTRLSPVRGTRDALKLDYIFIPKPVANKQFIYYALGVTWPKRLGIEHSSFKSWTRVSDLVQGEDLLAFPYIDHKVFPNSKVWMRRTEEGNTFFAVEIDNLKTKFDFSKDFVMRFYSNAWLMTEEGQKRERLEQLTGIVGDDLTGPQFMTKLNELKNKTNGDVIVFKNGYYTTEPNIPVITTGDCLAVYYDSTIREIWDMPLTGAHYYFSERDPGVRKMLVPIPEELRRGIQWNDDIEFFVSETQTGDTPFELGVYMPKHEQQQIRNVTTNDYAIEEDYLQDSINAHPFVDDFANTKIRLIMREADRPEFLFKDGLNLHDFFIIPHDRRLRVLKGLEDDKAQWTAAALENSNFMKFAFTADPWNYPLKKIFNFYGNQYYSNQPWKIYRGIFRIPPSMREGGLILEFNAAGELINIVDWVEWHIQLRYYPDVAVDKIRCVPGKKITSGRDLDLFSDYIDDEVTDWYEERYYKSPNNNTWSLANINEDFTLVDDKVQWKSAYLNYERRKRIANHYVRLEKTIDSEELGMPIDIFEDYSTTYTGLDFGHYYIFLNNRLLVYGVDYEIRFPQIYINALEYANKGPGNELIIIAHGCPNFNADPEVGFVELGKLTTKQGFRPLLHRNRDFVIDGRLQDENTVVFDSGYKLAHNFNETLSGVREGALFGIDDHTNHLGLADIEAITETQQEALNTDEYARVTLDEFYPVPDYSQRLPIVIPVKHTVVSIVLRKLIDDIKSGRLVIPEAGLSDLAVSVAMAPYRQLLESDISLKDLEHTYIEVAAHGAKDRYDITVAEHQFLHLVNENFLKGRCVLPQYFDI
ncbi:hypothetical protein SM033_00179 [Vibrio phage vB_VpaM_sm033]|nr:hypothetical protein SM033_00179 [Vibrio phage vB_VpaM_sm033]